MDATASKLKIANQALVKIGARKITDLTSTSDPNAVIMNGIYAQCRQELLEEHPFSFSLSTVTPSVITTLLPLSTFGDGVSVAYAVPSDFLFLYQVNFVSLIKFEMLRPPIVASNTYAMLSNVTGLIMKYVFDNDVPTTYTSKFIEALACKLAYEACFKISEAAQYASKVQGDYAKALASAQAADSKGSSPDQPAQDFWINARLTGSGAVAGLPDGSIGFSPNPYSPDF